ncbi:MAG: flagellar basal body P-ring protein FlgI [Phycisphaerales bacterium]
MSLRAILAALSLALPVSCAVAQVQRAGQDPTGAADGGAPQPLNVPTISIHQLVRIEGQAESQLRGLGIVTGLRGTGDSGQESVLARPLAELYKNSGNPIPDIKALNKSKSAAIVFLWANIPEEGARKGDKFDVYVKVGHTASSLEGGMLEISPLLGPKPGQGVFGLASGPITIENPAFPTVGKIHGGLQLHEDIRMDKVGPKFNLIVRPYYRGYSTTTMLAQQINDSNSSLEDEDVRADIAVALDDMTIQIVVPPEERAEPTNFIANLLEKRISHELLRLPATIVCNEREGTIVATPNVEFSAVATAHKDLIVTTTTPAVPPTAQNPRVDKTNWVAVDRPGRASQHAKVQDLLNAFNQLDVPVRDQIEILKSMYRSGRLFARLVIE